MLWLKLNYFSKDGPQQEGYKTAEIEQGHLTALWHIQLMLS